MRSFVSLAGCFALASAFVSLTALAGCAASTADATDVGTTSEALSTLGKSIVGEWDRTDGSGPLDITLQSDGTYFEDDQVYCFRAPCPPVRVKGAWSLASASSTKGTLRLYPAAGGTKTYALAYASSGPVLTLSANGNVEHLHRPAPTAGGDGAMCGGIAGLPCADGLTCVIDDPNVADAAGVCRARGERGTFCGGIAALPCNDGLYCVITATYPDAGGVCSARGELGTPCGGIAALPCNTGLVCKITDQGISDPMGTCVAQ